MSPQLGKIIVVLGLLLVALGLFLWLGGGSWLSWFGRLPGDIRVERPGFRFYAPIVSMLLVSLLLSLLLWLVRRLGQ
jgi:ribose/xylose/arabinose/galactoside ABC-type transport system permease subunit